MDKETENRLISLAAGGLGTCLRKLNSVSPGAWRLDGLRVSSGSMTGADDRDVRGVIRITVKSAPPMITLMLFACADEEHIYRCFVSDSFYKDLGPGMREITLLEVGNVLLNALANSLLKAFRKSAIPSVPERISAAPGAFADPGGAQHNIVSAALSVQRDGISTGIELVAMVPGDLAS
jgi:hypothetical protein